MIGTRARVIAASVGAALGGIAAVATARALDPSRLVELLVFMVGAGAVLGLVLGARWATDHDAS